MKQVNGMYLPDGEEHLVSFLERGPVVHGKGTYQFHKYTAALEHVKRRRRAVDIGAHVGLWSRVMSHDFEFVSSFEPNPGARECYRLNMVDRPNAMLYPYALGREKGEAFMTVNPASSGDTHIGRTPDAIDVTMHTLDYFGLTDIDFMKIDVEGFEYDVVLGARETIKSNKPVIVIEQKPRLAERFGHGQWDAKGLLVRLGMVEANCIGGDHIMVWGG